MSGFNLNYLFFVIVIGITSIYSTTRLRNRNDLFKAYLIIFASIIVTCFALGFANNYPYKQIFTNIGFGLFGGLMGLLLILILLSFFEEILDMSTDIKLLELCDLNHPLLKQLAEKAPGSFQHSLIVGNIAEAVADDINARGPLAKAGGYFHDIGKLKSPIFFIENQKRNFNPHNKIKPEKSAKILSDHVSFGIQFAIEHNLPTDVINIIEQHQGNLKMKFFYNKAIQNGEKTDENIFRYKFPKPQTKEAAIVMLCDQIEAKTRLLEEPDEQKIEKIISDTFDELINIEKQFDEVNISLKDLHIIKQTLKENLISIYHARIEY
jgi:putative nucleotidyltransferase with HDIG domain